MHRNKKIRKKTFSNRKPSCLEKKQSTKAVLYDVKRYILSSCVRLYVRPSVTSRYGIETTGRIELFWGRRLPSTCPTLCCMEIWVSSKIRVLPYGTLCQNPDLENFAKEADRVVNKTRHRRRRSSLLTSPKQQSTSRGCLLYKSVNCSPLTPLLRFVVDLLYNMFLQMTRF